MSCPINKTFSEYGRSLFGLHTQKFFCLCNDCDEQYENVENVINPEKCRIIKIINNGLPPTDRKTNWWNGDPNMGYCDFCGKPGKTNKTGNLNICEKCTCV